MAKNRPGGGARNGAEPRSSGPDELIEDEVAFQTNGTVRMRIDGDVHVLRRPTVGELRTYGEAWKAYEADRNQAARDANAERSEDDPAEPPTFDHDRWDAEWIDWWRMVFTGTGDASVDHPLKGLDRSGLGLAAEWQDCPQWLLSVDLVTEMFTHWRTVPWVGGTSPSQRKEAAQVDEAVRLAPTMAAVAPLVAGAVQQQNASATNNT